jgi:hypothetical protein
VDRPVCHAALTARPPGAPRGPGVAAGDLIEEEIHDRGVDLFLCGISGRRFTPHYIERIVRVLQPARIIPTHHDDLFRPLAATLWRPMTGRPGDGQRGAPLSQPCATTPRLARNCAMACQ